jgi:glycosyltransferase involved in cell wall biosynthesis
MMLVPINSLVAFSYDIFVAQRAGGISRCMIELMRSISKTGVGAYLWAGANLNEMVDEALNEEWTAGLIVSASRGQAGRVRGAWKNERQFSAWVSRAEPKVVHRTYYPMLDLLGRDRVCVETLHDMWDERSAGSGDKGSTFRSFFKKRACDRADVVVCVSEHTRQEVLNFWPNLEGRLHVIPHGVRRLSNSPIRANTENPYFLYVGKRGLYKNFERAVGAFSKAELNDHKIYCFGGESFSDKERAYFSELGVGERVLHFTGSDHVLAGLYENAAALIYPSSYEGFGLPLLEAMVHGCPVIAAPFTSLPEVGGDAVFYADPFCTDAWVDALRQIGLNENLGQTLRSKGFGRAAEFSWDHSGASHIALYSSLC